MKALANFSHDACEGFARAFIFALEKEFLMRKETDSRFVRTIVAREEGNRLERPGYLWRSCRNYASR